jgi:hypothetical protein
LKYIQPPTTDHPMTVRGKRTMRIFWQSFVDASVNAPYMALLSPAIAGRAGPSSVSRERHMMTPEKVLYETEVTATGGRDGKAASADGLLSVSLSLPKSLGGRGDEGTNPEQLYAACFLGAVKLVALHQEDRAVRRALRDREGRHGTASCRICGSPSNCRSACLVSRGRWRKRLSQARMSFALIQTRPAAILK